MDEVPILKTFDALCDCEADIKFDGTTFCFTGLARTGSRKKLAAIVEELGGVHKNEHWFFYRSALLATAMSIFPKLDKLPKVFIEVYNEALATTNRPKSEQDMLIWNLKYRMGPYFYAYSLKGDIEAGMSTLFSRLVEEIRGNFYEEVPLEYLDRLNKAIDEDNEKLIHEMLFLKTPIISQPMVFSGIVDTIKKTISSKYKIVE